MLSKTLNLSNMQLTQLDISKKSISLGITRFLARKLGKTDAEWRRVLSEEAGAASLVPISDEGASDYEKTFPAVVRIGAIKPRGRHNDGSLRFFAECDVPALIDMRNRSATLHHGFGNGKVMAEILQGYLLNIVGQLDPSVVQCTIVDQGDFGSAFSIAGSVLKNPKIITDRYGVEDLFRTLTNDLTQRNRTRGHAFHYIYDYNSSHADSSVPYHFILVASYEDDLTDDNKATLARMLANDNAARAGIYFMIMHQSSETFDALRVAFPQLPALSVNQDGDGLKSINVFDRDGLNTEEAKFSEKFVVLPDVNEVSLGALVDRIRLHAQIRRIESVRLPLPSDRNWAMEAWKNNTIEGLAAIIGKARGMPMTFRLGAPEIVHNALVGGAVGTGKTNLLHAIILQCLANYSPEELQLSLLDYKNGTEFNVYSEIPHLYALSLGARSKFGTDLLQHFKHELERRAELFKLEGVTSNSGYRTKTGKVLPRHLVVIDEFQVLLGDKRLGYVAQADLEDLIRRGRSFGFNFILSSQSLKDCTLSSPAKSNIGCRICLKLSESDCGDFLSVENTVPSRFQEVGQALINTQEGRLENNVEFRVAHYSDQQIAEFCALLAVRGPANRNPYVYRGNERLLKKDMRFPTPDGLRQSADPKGLLLGVEEGIPAAPLWLNLDQSRGPIFCCGTGATREKFEANLSDEIALTGCNVRHVEGAGIGALVSELHDNGEVLPGVMLLLVRLRQRDSVDPAVQAAVGQLVLSSPSKLILFMESPSAFRNLYLDRNAADFLVCLDQRSYAEFGMGSELAGEPCAAAIFYPGEQNAVIVKIPQLD